MAVELKHIATDDYIKTFLKKVDFIETHKSEQWVYQRNPVAPIEIIPAVGSFGRFKLEESVMKSYIDKHDLVFLIRSYTDYYEIFDNKK